MEKNPEKRDSQKLDIGEKPHSEKWTQDLATVVVRWSFLALEGGRALGTFRPSRRLSLPGS